MKWTRVILPNHILKERTNHLDFNITSQESPEYPTGQVHSSTYDAAPKLLSGIAADSITILDSVVFSGPSLYCSFISKLSILARDIIISSLVAILSGTLSDLITHSPSKNLTAMFSSLKLSGVCLLLWRRT